MEGSTCSERVVSSHMEPHKIILPKQAVVHIEMCVHVQSGLLVGWKAGMHGKHGKGENNYFLKINYI
jgi:hypothetical protein